MNLKKKILGVMLAFMLAVTGVAFAGCGGTTPNNPVIDDGGQVTPPTEQEETYNIEFSFKYSLDGNDWEYTTTEDGEKKVGYDEFGTDAETGRSNVLTPLDELNFDAVADLSTASTAVLEFKITNNTEDPLYYLINLINSSVSIETDAETGDGRIVVGEVVPAYALYHITNTEKDVQDIQAMYDDDDLGFTEDEEGLFEIRGLYESLDADAVKKMIGEPPEDDFDWSYMFMEPTSESSADCLVIDNKNVLEGWANDEVEEEPTFFTIAPGASRYLYVYLNIAEDMDADLLEALTDYLNSEEGFASIFRFRLSADRLDGYSQLNNEPVEE